MLAATVLYHRLAHAALVTFYHMFPVSLCLWHLVSLCLQQCTAQSACTVQSCKHCRPYKLYLTQLQMGPCAHTEHCLSTLFRCCMHCCS